MKKHQIALFSLLFWVSIAACSVKTEKENKGINLAEFEEIPNRFAKRFSVQKSGDFYAVFITNAKSDTIFRYFLSPKNKPEVAPSGFLPLHYPAEDITIFSVKYAAYLDALGKNDLIKNFSGLEYAYNPVWHEKVKNGAIEAVKINGVADFEKVLSLKTDLILDYLPNGNSPVLDKMLAHRLPVFVAAEYLEEHPLGQAEWIKIFGILAGDRATAERIFDETEKNYTAEKVTQTPENAPSVFCNIPYGDVWYIPGMDNFTAVFVRDAGGKYTWEDLQGSGSVPLSLESVFERAQNADIWLNAADYKEREKLASLNNLTGKFSAFKSGKVFAYTKRMSEGGGCDYFESGAVRPDLILKDLKIIFSGGDEKSLFFYERLK